MSITPFQPGAIELPEHKTEDQLYAWMDSQCAGKLERAKIAVNEWWTAVVTALIVADKFYGWDSTVGSDSGNDKSMPIRLKKWCNDNGLDTNTRVANARSIARASLRHQLDVEEMIEEIGVGKAMTIGFADSTKSEQLLDAALDGATGKELKDLNRELEDDVELLNLRLKNKEREHEINLTTRASITEGYESEAYLKANSDVRSTRNSIKNLKSKIEKCTVSKQKLGTDLDSGKQINQLRDELKSAKAEAEEARAEADKLFKVTERNKELSQRIEELSDVKYVTPDLIDHRLEMINLQSVTWSNLAYTFDKARELSTDPSEVTRAQKGILHSWEQWIHHLPMDVLSELEAMFIKRMAEETITDTSIPNIINVTTN